MPNLDEEYVEVAIEEFASGEPVPFAIFIRLSSWKYLQIAYPGDGLDQERISLYKDKNVRCLYLRKADFAKHVEFKAHPPEPEEELTPLPPPIVDPVAVKRLAAIKESAEVTLELIRGSGINDLLFDSAKEFVQSTISVMADDHAAFVLLVALNGQASANRVFEHSIGTCMYSVMLGRILGWKSSQNLFKVGMGGLLHDIGENSLDDALLLKPEKSLTEAERAQRRKHPEWGAEILRKLTAAPPEVIAITLEHHENEAGEGYPSGMDSSRIHAMAKVVAVADRFCELVLDGPTSLHMSTQDALKEILKAKSYNPDVVDALKRLLKGMSAP